MAGALRQVDILVHRSLQQEMEGGQPSVESFTVIDNGIGFNDENRESFDTLYTDQKIAQGGKGFGRFTCLKYFDDLVIESVFAGEDGRKKRSFKMGKRTDIIVDEKIEDCPDGEIGSRVTMKNVKGRGFPDKQIMTVARTLVERLLPYFIDSDCRCPEIRLAEEDGTGQSHATKDALSKQLRETEQQIENLLDRIVESGNPSLVSAYESRLEKLERDKIVISERVARTVPPKGRLEDCIEHALKFLANPWILYKNGDFVMRQTVLRLVFSDPLRYSPNGVYGTPNFSFPFKYLAGISGAKSEMVLLERIELSTSPLPRVRSTTELQQPRHDKPADPTIIFCGCPRAFDPLMPTAWPGFRTYSSARPKGSGTSHPHAAPAREQDRYYG